MKIGEGGGCAERERMLFCWTGSKMRGVWGGRGEKGQGRMRKNDEDDDAAMMIEEERRKTRRMT